MDLNTENSQSKLTGVLVFSGGCLLGALIFWLTYGFSIVNPEYDGWVNASGGDLSQHYMGWKFFRRSPWAFPLGLTEGLSSDGMVSCMYTDSIPLFAVFFKLLSPLLPDTFQYVGIWELTSFILMGGFSSLLVNRFSRNPVFCIFSSAFFILAPSVLTRSLHHEALSAQWILVAAILLWTYAGHDWMFRAAPAVLWTLLGVISVTVHVYFLGMILMIMAGYILSDVFLKKRILHSVYVLGFTLLFSVITMFVFGAFYGDSDFTAGGLGRFSANYNFLYNSYGHSDFLKPPAVYNSNQEGFGYAGLGMMVMAVTGIVFAVISCFTEEDGFFSVLGRRIKKYWFHCLAALLVMAGAVFFAASPTGTFNDRIIYEINYPETVQKFLMVFRASGRFVWVADYILFTGITAAVASVRKKAFILPALAVCLGIQLLDLRTWLVSFHTRYTAETVYESPLKSDEWDTVTEGRDMFIFTPVTQAELGAAKTYRGFAEYACDRGMSLSSFYFARTSAASLSEYAQKCLDDLSAGKGMKNAVYIILNPEAVPENSSVEVKVIDGYTVALQK